MTLTSSRSAISHRYLVLVSQLIALKGFECISQLVQQQGDPTLTRHVSQFFRSYGEQARNSRAGYSQTMNESLTLDSRRYSKNPTRQNKSSSAITGGEEELLLNDAPRLRRGNDVSGEVVLPSVYSSSELTESAISLGGTELYPAYFSEAPTKSTPDQLTDEAALSLDNGDAIYDGGESAAPLELADMRIQQYLQSQQRQQPYPQPTLDSGWNIALSVVSELFKYVSEAC